MIRDMKNLVTSDKFYIMSIKLLTYMLVHIRE